MGFFSVLRPCVVGKLHYATVPVQPIEVDDDVAAPLVKSGDLEPYQPGAQVTRPTEADYAETPVQPHEIRSVAFPPDTSADVLATAVKTYLEDEATDTPAESEKPSPRPRSTRRPKA